VAPRSTFFAIGLAAAASLLLSAAHAATVYDPGVSPDSTGFFFGDHLVGAVPHTSVVGSGGGGLSDNGDSLNGLRSYIYDRAAQADLTDGVANRGDTDFAMMIWDMGTRFDSIRLYTHQDHYSPPPVTDPFLAQDLMEYSVWGSDDGDNFSLLSDVVAFDINGGGTGLPTYTFAGTEASVVYRGGSTEFGTVNAYTREYVFSAPYRYFGIRTSQISLDANDADPEIDAIGAFITNVPEPTTGALLGLGLASCGVMAGRRASRRIR
jgi:hypothetical protein